MKTWRGLVMNKRSKKSLYILITAVVLLFHCVYVYFSYFQVPLNSDHANQVLEAADILKGNVLLHGWNLTGVSFYLSEIPFYVLGTAVRGVDTFAYIIAASLMVILLSLSGYLLSVTSNKQDNFHPVFLYLALTGFPTLTLLGFLRGHCAIFIYFFLMLLCMDRIMSDKRPGVVIWLFLGLLTVCGCLSDMQLVIIGVVPILLFCAVNLLRNVSGFDRKKTAVLAGILVYGTGLGMVADSLLMRFGGVNKNSFLNTRSFVDMDALQKKFLLLGKGIFEVFRCDFPETAWSIRNIVALVFVSLVLLSTFFFLVRTMRTFISDGYEDPVSVVLSFSLVLMTLVCFFTDIYTDKTSPRYISYMPFAAGVLICRSMREYARKTVTRLGLVSFLCAVLIFGHPLRSERIETKQDRLAVFLEENGLTEGYSDFWNASHTTVASNERVKVRAIHGQVPELGKPDYLVMQNWFCKTEWYRQGTPNFIAFDGSGYLHVSEDIVLILLGEPSRILDNGEYRVYVYENGLSDEIVIPKGQVAE